MPEKIAVGLLIFLLKQAGASTSDIPNMLAIAQMESGLNNNIEGEENNNKTKDVGLWQVNAESYWHDSEGTNDNSKGPDNFTKEWMKNNGGELSFDEFREKVKTDLEYSTQFAVDLVKYRNNNPINFPDGKYGAWSVWNQFIEPYVEKGITDIIDSRQEDMDLAISYIDNYGELEETPPTTTTTTTIPSTSTTVVDNGDDVVEKVDPTKRTRRELEMRESFSRMTAPERVPSGTFMKSYQQMVDLFEAQINKQRESRGLPPVDRQIAEQSVYMSSSDSFREAIDILKGLSGETSDMEKPKMTKPIWTSDMEKPKMTKPVWRDDMEKPKMQPLDNDS